MVKQTKQEEKQKNWLFQRSNKAMLKLKTKELTGKYLFVYNVPEYS